MVLGFSLGKPRESGAAEVVIGVVKLRSDTSKNAGGPRRSTGSRYPSAAAGCARLCSASRDPRRAGYLASQLEARPPNVKLSCVAFREPRRPRRVGRSEVPSLQAASPSGSARSSPTYRSRTEVQRVSLNLRSRGNLFMDGRMSTASAAVRPPIAGAARGSPPPRRASRSNRRRFPDPSARG